MVKVFLDGHFLCGKRHGIAIYIEQLYLALLYRHEEINLIIGIEKHNTQTESLLFQHSRVTLVEYKHGNWMRFVLDIPILVNRLKPDFVHTQNFISLWRKRSVRYHVTLFDVLYEDFPEYFTLTYRYIRTVLFRIAALICDDLSTCSEYSAQRISLHYGIDINKIFVINGGINLTNNYSPTENKYGDYILYVSRFEKRKNHQRLLEAFALILQEAKNCKLILVGFEVDGSLLKAKKLAKSLNISSSVIFLENISDSLLTSLYSNALVVAYPSLCEGFGLPVIESIILNPYTIFSDSSSMSNFKFAGDSMFDARSPASIFRKIQDVINSRKLYNLNWQQKKNFIYRNYTWSISGDVLFKIYSK